MADWADMAMAIGMLVLVVGMVALVLAGVFVSAMAARTRQRAWDEYVKEREAKGYRHVEPSEPWSKS